MRIELSNKAAKLMRRLEKPSRERIKKGLAGLEKQPPEGDIKPLQGIAGSYRLRIGDWRIIYSYLSSDVVLVEKISPRGDAYKGV